MEVIGILCTLTLTKIEMAYFKILPTIEIKLCLNLENIKINPIFQSNSIGINNHHHGRHQIRLWTM